MGGDICSHRTNTEQRQIDVPLDIEHAPDTALAPHRSLRLGEVEEGRYREEVRSRVEGACERGDQVTGVRHTTCRGTRGSVQLHHRTAAHGGGRQMPRDCRDSRPPGHAEHHLGRGPLGQQPRRHHGDLLEPVQFGGVLAHGNHVCLDTEGRREPMADVGPAAAGLTHRDPHDPLLARRLDQPGDRGPGDAQRLGDDLHRLVLQVIHRRCAVGIVLTHSHSPIPVVHICARWLRTRALRASMAARGAPPHSVRPPRSHGSKGRGDVPTQGRAPTSEITTRHQPRPETCERRFEPTRRVLLLMRKRV